MKTYTTLRGARLANPDKMMLRVLADGVDDVFIPVPLNTTIFAVNPKTGSADGYIDVAELVTRHD